MADMAASRSLPVGKKGLARTSNRRRRTIALSIVLGAILVSALIAGLTMPPELYASDFSQKQRAVIQIADTSVVLRHIGFFLVVKQSASVGHSWNEWM